MSASSACARRRRRRARTSPRAPSAPPAGVLAARSAPPSRACAAPRPAPRGPSRGGRAPTPPCSAHAGLDLAADRARPGATFTSSACARAASLRDAWSPAPPCAAPPARFQRRAAARSRPAGSNLLDLGLAARSRSALQLGRRGRRRRGGGRRSGRSTRRRAARGRSRDRGRRGLGVGAATDARMFQGNGACRRDEPPPAPASASTANVTKKRPARAAGRARPTVREPAASRPRAAAPAAARATGLTAARRRGDGGTCGAAAPSRPLAISAGRRPDGRAVASALHPADGAAARRQRRRHGPGGVRARRARCRAAGFQAGVRRRASSRSRTESPATPPAAASPRAGASRSCAYGSTLRLGLVKPEQVGDGARAPPQRLHQVVLELRHRLVALRRILRQRAHDDPIQILGQLQAQRARGADRRSAVALLGRLPGHHLVEQRAHRIDVAAVIDDAARRLLGRHVLGRPHRDARVGEPARRARRCARRRSRAP